MRDYPWLERPVSWFHLRIFEAIVDRLALISSWRDYATEKKWPLPQSSKSAHQGIAFQWIQSIPDGASEAFLSQWCETSIGGRTPEEALLELGRAARVLEFECAESLLGHGSELEEVSRTLGWKTGVRQHHEGVLRVDGRRPESLLSCAMAVQQSALGWLDRPSQEPPFVERDLPSRIDWVLSDCPHQDPLAKNVALADFICAQHVAWFRGYSDSLDLRLSLRVREREPSLERCRISLLWEDA